MNGRIFAAFLGFALALAFATPTAHACAVCGAGQGESALAFLRMTLIMSALPLCLIGGAVLWFWSRARALEREGEIPELEPAAPEVRLARPAALAPGSAPTRS